MSALLGRQLAPAVKPVLVFKLQAFLSSVCTGRRERHEGILCRLLGCIGRRAEQGRSEPGFADMGQTKRHGVFFDRFSHNQRLFY